MKKITRAAFIFFIMASFLVLAGVNGCRIFKKKPAVLQPGLKITKLVSDVDEQNKSENTVRAGAYEKMTYTITIESIGLNQNVAVEDFFDRGNLDILSISGDATVDPPLDMESSRRPAEKNYHS